MADVYDPNPEMEDFHTSSEGDEEREVSDNEEGGSFKTNSELDDLGGDTDMQDSHDEEHEYSTLGT